MSKGRGRLACKRLPSPRPNACAPIWRRSACPDRGSEGCGPGSPSGIVIGLESLEGVERVVELTPGDPAPIFVAKGGKGAFRLATAGGRYLVLCFFGSAGDPAMEAMLRALLQRADVFDGERAGFVAIGCDRGDQQAGRIEAVLPGFEVVWDFNRDVATMFGIVDEGASGETIPYRRQSIIL